MRSARAAARPARPVSRNISMLLMITPRILLKSWAMPPARVPTASIFWAWLSCRSRATSWATSSASQATRCTRPDSSAMGYREWSKIWMSRVSRNVAGVAVATTLANASDRLRRNSSGMYSPSVRPSMASGVVPRRPAPVALQASTRPEGSSRKALRRGALSRARRLASLSRSDCCCRMRAKALPPCAATAST